MTPAGQGFDVALIWQIAGWAVVAAGGLLLLWALFRDRARGRRRCPKCWYDMKGVPGLRCPECGREAKQEKKLFKTRRKYGVVLLALAIMAIGAASLRVPRALKYGWLDPIPAFALRPALWLNREKARELHKQYNSTATPMMFAPGPAVTTAALTQWERLLVAYHISQLLDLRAAPYDRLSTSYGTQGGVQALAFLGREGRPAIGALKRGAWDPSSTVTPGALDTLSRSLEVDLTGDFLRLAEVHPARDIRIEALQMLVWRALETGRAPAALLRLCARTGDDAATACGVIANPSSVRSITNYSLGGGVASAPAAKNTHRDSAAIAILRAMLKSKDPLVLSRAMWCLSPLYAEEFEDDLDALWLAGLPEECLPAFAGALGSYGQSAAKWSPRLLALIESPDHSTVGNALNSLARWSAAGEVDRDTLVQWLAEHDRSHPADAPRRAADWLHQRIVGTWEYGDQHLLTLVRLIESPEVDATALLLDVLSMHAHDTYRIRAASLLGGREVAPDIAHRVLTGVLAEPRSGYLRHCAFEALGPHLLNHPGLNALVVRALGDSHANVMMYGAELASISPADPEIDALLARLAERAPDSVGIRAQRAIMERQERGVLSQPGTPAATKAAEEAP